MGLPNVNLHILAAPPGSDIYSRYKKEGRLVYSNTELGVGHFPTLHYMNMSQTELFDSYMKTIEKLYSWDTVYQKAQMLFSGGAFIRKGGDISVVLKARLTWITLKEFLFTSNKTKRKLFFFIFQLIRGKKIAIDKGLGFLLSMLGYHRHVESHKKHMEEYRNMVIQQDKGPWNKMI
jgi:hypothetical protein